MGFTSNTSPVGPAPISSSTPDTHLIRGALIGLLAALILMPAHSLLVSWGYHDGYYSDYPELLPLFAILVALAVRFGAASYGALVAVIAIPLTVTYMVGSEYLVARFLVNQTLIEDGYTALPLVVSPLIGIKLLGLYIQNDPAQLIMWVIALVGAGFLAMLRNLTGGMSYQLSGKSPAALTATSVPARPSVIPSPALAKVRMEDIPSDAYALGQPVQAFHTRVVALALTGGLLFLLGLAPVAALILSHAQLDTIVFVGALSLICIGPGVYRLAQAIIHVNNHVLIFNDGLSIEQQGRTVVLKWADIDAVWMDQYRYTVNGIPIIDRHNYKLDTRTSGRVVLDKTYKDIRGLGMVVESAVARTKLPGAIDALQRGESIVFGTLTIRRDGLTLANRLYRWQDSTVAVEPGHLRLHDKTESRFKDKLVGFSTLPNLDLLIALVSATLEGKLAAPAAPDSAASSTPAFR